jgi:FlaA1/EpsC-like NDP-sugar epimerase
LLFALLFHFDLNLNIRYNPLIFPVPPFFVAVKIGSFVLFRIYKMTWRYVGLYDFLSIFIATVTATFVLMLAMLLPWDLPLSGFSKRVVLADGIITLFLISRLRVTLPPALLLSRHLSRIPNRRMAGLHQTVKKWLAEDVYDTRRFEKAYGFQTRTSLEDGL